MADTARAKLMQATKELKARMIERDDEIETTMTAMVAGEHVLFVGPPGTGKSMLCDAVSELLDGPRFSYLMTKFTAPEEVFGPVSLKGLQNDQYVRITTGKLPEAEVVFLDEIFKSSSAILNTLLKALNERTYDAGNGAAAIPMQICVAASNEWPTGEGQQELGALFDRFLLRRTVKPIATADGRRRLRFDRAKPAPLTVKLTAAELEAARAEAAALPWSDEAMDAYDSIVRELNREGIFPGDRRERKAVGVVQAAAWLAGATEVEKDHLQVLADVLWDAPEEQPTKCANVVSRTANPAQFQINALLVEVEQVLSATDIKNLSQVTASAQKLGEVARKLRVMKGNNKADKAYQYVDQRVKALKQAAMDAM
jgi:MoxR-like ATPase